MKWSLVTTSVLVVAVAACGGGEDPAAGPPAQTEPAAQQPAQAAPQMPTQTQPAAPSMPPVTRRPAAAGDEPWTPTMTGTVSPGMTRDQVLATWGEPVTERVAGNRTYLYFRNGCEASCGTYDVVFLEDGQVVDAIVRGAGHTYAGVSSSPPDRAAQFTAPVP